MANDYKDEIYKLLRERFITEGANHAAEILLQESILTEFGKLKISSPNLDYSKEEEQISARLQIAREQLRVSLDVLDLIVKKELELSKLTKNKTDIKGV